MLVILHRFLHKLFRRKAYFEQLRDNPYSNKNFKFMQTNVRVLSIDDKVKAIIAKLVQYATDNKLELSTIEKIADGSLPAIGDDVNYVCYIPDGYRVVFTIEQQKDEKWYRHISISVNSKTKLPSIPAAEMIMREFGFNGSINDLDHVWIENKISPAAVNLLQACDV